MTEELQALKTAKTISDWSEKVLGGGRIKHDPTAKSLHVYGYSQVVTIMPQSTGVLIETV